MVICSSCQYRNDFVTVRQRFVGDVNPEVLRMEPRCMASRVGFVGSTVADFALCSEINAFGGCVKFRAVVTPPTFLERLRAQWKSRRFRWLRIVLV